MKKISIVIFLFILSTIPSFAGMKSTMDRLMDSWIGENINSVIDLWGSPTDEKIIADGKIYYWNKSQDIIMGGFSVYMLPYGGTSTCNKNFEVDENNIIIKGNWDGNACPSTYREVKKYVNPQNNYWKNKNTPKISK